MLVLAILALIAWVYLVCCHGKFWSARVPEPVYPDAATETSPTVTAVVPARNEAEVIGETVRRLLAQDYAGPLQIIVVDDHSDDGTAAIARAAACGDPRLRVLSAAPLPAGWTGKVWAMHQGEQATARDDVAPEFLWLTDADIHHSADTLDALVGRAEQDDRDLVSRMALLCTDTFWEKLMIPAFVYFFQLLYPFGWSNNSNRKTAAAAGGCVLVRSNFLAQIGGIAAIRDALIDDCTLARKVKKAGGRLWLELTRDTVSARGYGSLGGLWNMIARTAYTQLFYNPALLFGCVLGLGLVFLVPPILALGLLGNTGLSGLLGLAAWALMVASFLPMAKFYYPGNQARALGVALALPLTALLYLAATVESARRYHLGAGGQWKGRAQAPPQP